jgi:hypothetical protein
MRMDQAEFKAILDRLTHLSRILHDADPENKAETLRRLDLRLTYRPARRLVEATAEPPQYGFSTVSQGDLNRETGEISLIMDLSSKLVINPRIGDLMPLSIRRSGLLMRDSGIAGRAVLGRDVCDVWLLAWFAGSRTGPDLGGLVAGCATGRHTRCN